MREHSANSASPTVRSTPNAEVLRAHRINGLHDAHAEGPTFGYRFLADETRRVPVTRFGALEHRGPLLLIR